jgi:general secretion pathway protein G
MRNYVNVVALVLMLCATSCERTPSSSHPPAAMTQIAAFTTALETLKADCGRFPSTAEGLAALTSRPAGLTETQWHGPYLDAAIPKDPWGHEYVYACPGVHNTNGFDVYSPGPDGASKSGGEDYDDISNWAKQRTMR